MNLGLKNRLRLISLFPIIILFSIASYAVYSTYKNYTLSQSLEDKLFQQATLSNTKGAVKKNATKELEEILQRQVNTDIVQLADEYLSFLKLQNYIKKEKSFVENIVQNSQIISQQDMDKLLLYIAKSDAINYSNIPNTGLVTQLDTLFKGQSFITLHREISQQRMSFFGSGLSGEYALDLQSWKASNSKKSAFFTRAEEIILQALRAKSSQVKDETLRYLAIAISIWLVSIILGILGYLLSNEISRNIKSLEGVLVKVAEDAIHIGEVEINLDTATGTKKAYELLEKIIEQIKNDKQFAQEASEAKSMFLANMSHEIRTPLNGIVGFTELLKDTGLEEEQHEFVEIIEKSSENLLEIINNILDLSKIESNKLEIEDVAFNPIEEFESAVDVYAVRASEKHINLSCFIDPSLNQPIKGDPTKIKEVIINLLSNAVKFTGNSGSINVDIRRLVIEQDGITRIKFAVEDSGIGVTSEQKARIFEAFSQADTSITRKYGGTGLGLTISSNFIELMGGQLDLESEIGEGTTFFFTIDFEESERVNDSGEGLFTNIHAAVLQSKHQSKRQEKYLCEYLDYYGVTYTLFGNSDELEILARQTDFDMLFIDYDYTDENALNIYSKSSQELVLLTKSYYKKAIDAMSLNILKTIYEPLNSSKIQNLLQNYHKIKSNEKTKEVIQEIVPQSKFDANILIAEDNIINQKLIKRTLEEMGLTISIASNGLEAFQKRKDGNYDLIFMDIQMPFLDGVEATQEIIEYEKVYNKPHIPIIALTANALKGDREIFLEAGLDEYTTKPLVRLEIISLLNHFLVKPKIKPVEIEVDTTVEETSSDFEYHADILLIKKTPFEAKLFSKIIKILNYSYEIATSTEEMMSKIGDNSYKVILFDAQTDNLDIEKLLAKVNQTSRERVLKSSLVAMNDGSSDSKLELVDDVINSVVSKDLLRFLLDKYIKD